MQIEFDTSIFTSITAIKEEIKKELENYGMMGQVTDIVVSEISQRRRTDKTYSVEVHVKGVASQLDDWEDKLKSTSLKIDQTTIASREKSSNTGGAESSSSGGDDGSSTGAIVGGVVGGLLALTIIVVLVLQRRGEDKGGFGASDSYSMQTKNPTYEPGAAGL